MAQQQQPNSDTQKPHDRISENRPVEFPNLPEDDKKGRILKPEGIDKDLDPSENQTRYSDSDAETAAGDGGTVEDTPAPDDQVI